MAKKIALFVGRFQPFHNGHLSVVKRLSKKYDLVKIGIGSSQLSGTNENPFTAVQRRAMIRATMHAEGISHYKIYFLPDVDNDDVRWVELAHKTFGVFDVAYSGNSWVLRVFKDAGIKTIRLREIQPYSGTRIRKLLKNKKSVKVDVPTAVYYYLSSAE